MRFGIEPRELPRLIISGVILAMFGVAFWRNPDNQLLLGALVVMATGAKDFWFGTSKGSSDKSRQLEQLAQPSPPGAREAAQEVEVRRT